MATRFRPRPGPALAVIGLRPHHWVAGQFGRCRACPMPKGNRVHSTDEIDKRAAEWAEHDAARLGEREL